jgi:hypothetical protein
MLSAAALDMIGFDVTSPINCDVRSMSYVWPAILSDQFLSKVWVTSGLVSALFYKQKPQHLIHQSLFLDLWLHILCCFFTVDRASCVRLQLVTIILLKH